MAVFTNKELTRDIISLEWEMFDQVQNIGGRASCQDNFPVFFVMRAAQFDAWSQELRESYLADITAAKEAGRNLLTEKYAYMDGHEYLGEPCNLDLKKTLCSEIERSMSVDTAILHENWPTLAKRSRPLTPETGKMVSVDTYLSGELLTYSIRTLRLLLAYLDSLHAEGKNLPEVILLNTIKMAGYSDLDDAEAKLNAYE